MSQEVVRLGAYETITIIIIIIINYHNDFGPKEVARQEAYERQLQQQAEHERQLQVSKLSR